MSCSKDFELRESVSNPDPNNPDLPAYSEMGYNNFGAYYDRNPFTSTTRTPLKVVVENGKISFKFRGSIIDELDYNSSLRQEIDLHLIMPNYITTDSKELSLLHDSIINLKNDDVEVKIYKEGILQSVEILNGNFHFKKVQELIIDEAFEEMILSGTFEFQALINGDPVTVDYGRFDMGVGYSSFYILD